MDSINPDPANIPDRDLDLHNYQDDLDTGNNITDPVMHEDDDITEELGVDPKEFKAELDKYDVDDPYENDDRREQLEDLDQET